MIVHSQPITNPDSIAAIVATVGTDATTAPTFETIRLDATRTQEQKERDALTLLHNLPEPYGSMYRELIPYLPTEEEARAIKAMYTEQSEAEREVYRSDPVKLEMQRAVVTALREAFGMITDFLVTTRRPDMFALRRRYPHHIANSIVAIFYGSEGARLKRAFRERETAVEAETLRRFKKG